MRLLSEGQKASAAALVEMLFPAENFNEPDETMMVGVLVLNFPEDYCRAIDDDDLDQVGILLDGDRKALERSL